MVYATHSKRVLARDVGSSPTPGTKEKAQSKDRAFSLVQLDLSDEPHSRLERIVSWLPGCWADLALMRLNVLCSLKLSIRFFRRTTNAVIVHLHSAECSRRINDERPAKRQSLVWYEREVASLDKHAERVRDLA